MVWSGDTSVMHKTGESTRYERGLFYSHSKGKRQTRKSSVRWRKRRRRNIWREEACRILRLIRQRLWSVWFSCKKRNTNSCDRTGLFFSQTVVQHQTKRAWCVWPGDTLHQRQTHWSYCVKKLWVAWLYSLSEHTLNLFLKVYKVFCPQRVHT